MDIKEIRGKFPQYSDLSDQQLADAVHKTFYSDMPKEQYYSKIGFSHPKPTDPNAPSVIGSFVRGVGQGVTGEFGDEMLGVAKGTQRALGIQEISGIPILSPLGSAKDLITTAGKGLVGIGEVVTGKKTAKEAVNEAAKFVDHKIGEFGDGYNEATEAYRNVLAKDKEANPGTYLAGQIVGGLASVVAPGAAGVSIAGNLGKGATTLAGKAAGAIGRGGIEGAFYGGLYGAGGAEGGAQNRALGAAAGAGIGGAGGAVLPVAGGLIKGAVRTVLPNLSVISSSAARNAMIDALKRDGITPEMAVEKLATWEKSGASPAALFDLGGENLKALARQIYTMPGAGRTEGAKVIEERVAGQGQRIANTIASKVSAENFYGTLDDIVLRRSEAAKPLYEEAYKVGPLWNGKLELLLRRPALVQAYKNAREIAANEGRELPSLKLDKNGNLDPGAIAALRGSVDMQSWDYIKRGLDDVIQGQRNPITRKIESESGRAVDSSRRELLEQLDNLNPAYKKARGVFASETAVKDALEYGRSFAKEDADILAHNVKEMSDAERDAFQIGFARGLLDRVQSAPDNSNVVKKIFGNPKARFQIRALFKDQNEFDKFANNMEHEVEAYKNAKFIEGGSQTANKLAEADDFSQHVAVARRGVDAATDIVTGNWGNAIAPLARDGLNAVGRRVSGLNEQTTTKLAAAMYNRDAQQIRQILNALSKAEQENVWKAARKQVLGSSGAVTAGSLVIQGHD